MATPIRTAMTDNSAKDGSGDAINGSEVDLNPNTLADILDGTTQTAMGQAASLLLWDPVTMNVGAWTASTIYSGLQVRHDPASGTANDTSGIEIRFQGDNDAATPETIDYASIRGMFLDSTDATEDGGLTFRLMAAGTEVNSLELIDGTLSFRGAATIDTSGNNAMTLSAGTAALTVTAGDLTLYDDNDNADTSFSLGTSATERLKIEVLNGVANKSAESINIVTQTAAAGANAGQFTIGVDDATILTIDDGGINAILGATTPAAATVTTLSASSLAVTGDSEIQCSIATPWHVVVDTGVTWSCGWWQSADNRWWWLWRAADVASFTRADADFYIPWGAIGDVPAA